jgi:PBSX family phage terminase large subunit
MSQKEAWLFGRRVRIEGANDERAESKIRGATYQGAYVDEASKVPRGFFAMLLSRLRLPNAKLFATTNPENPSHWLKVDYIDRAEDLSFLDMKFLLDDNTTLPKDYVENIKLEYTGVYYERFILGNWVMAEGLIYPMFEKAIGEAPASRAETYQVSIDYGTQNAFAAYLWGKYGAVWWAVEEYYYSGRETGRQKTDKEYADDLDRFTADYLGANGKIKVIVDPSAASFIAELRRRGRYAVIPADNDVIDGIRETASAMEQGKIKISSKLERWRMEAGGYVWDETAAEDRPIKIDDHAMDSTRYFVKTNRIVVTKKPYQPIWNR